MFAYTADEDERPGARYPPESVVALDTTTGEVRWNMSEQHPQSSFAFAAGDLAVVRVPDPEPGSDEAARGRSETLVVEAATGREVASFGTLASACGAGDELIACAVGAFGDDERLATFRVGDREASVSESALPRTTVPVFVRAVVDGRIVLDQHDHRPASTMDRFANTIDTELPGHYLAMSDRYALFEPEAGRPETSPGTGAYAVHRIAS